MAYGVTVDGFVKKDLNTILEENKARFRTAFGNDIELSDESPLGLINNIISFDQSLLWDLGEGVYNAMYQQFAEGVPLDNAMALTSNERLDPIKSTAVVTITGTSTTLVEAGFRASVVGDSSNVFETLNDITIPVAGFIDIVMVATEFGAKAASAGTLTVIDTPVFGVSSVNNAADATIGRGEQTDAEFKLAAEDEKQKSGTSPVEGIRAAILDVDNIVQVLVNENDTDVTDGDGRPPHSVEAVVQGGNDTEIAQAILDSKAGGIQTFGSVTEIIVDNQGISKTINFNRPTTKNIYVIVNITKNTDTNEGPLYPVDGDDQVEDAIIAWGADFLIGQDVLRDGAKGIINPINSVAGIREVVVYFALTPAPATFTPVAIANNELATFISANITVNS
jgi:uncharacterized phage protein gp47/JayE